MEDKLFFSPFEKAFMYNENTAKEVHKKWFITISHRHVTMPQMGLHKCIVNALTPHIQSVWQKMNALT